MASIPRRCPGLEYSMKEQDLALPQDSSFCVFILQAWVMYYDRHVLVMLTSKQRQLWPFNLWEKLDNHAISLEINVVELQCLDVHNGIKVALFVNNKELKTYQHYPRYQDVELFSYIGGYLGIWLGISLANVLEMIVDYTTKAKRWFLYLKGQSSKTIVPIEQAVSTIDVKGK
ncbi:uncharacterized protein LOC143251690 [Tachypleus tridentatus]|uniref:uncharacterized protein LOC143251690 n=1 Tax=Tachypleus tridentatus TaxID=6853 RepID=UPI003FD53C54